MSLRRPVDVRRSSNRPELILSGRLTQDFDGQFWAERPGYIRTDVFPHRGARYRWHRNARYRGDLHLAHDYGAPEGTPVYAMADGKIITAGRDGTGGYFIYQQIRVGRVYKVIALYYHLKAGSIRVREGQVVTKGTRIASVGNTGGISTGAHLHAAATRYLKGTPRSMFYFGANATKSTGFLGVSFDLAPLITGTATLKGIAP